LLLCSDLYGLSAALLLAALNQTTSSKVIELIRFKQIPTDLHRGKKSSDIGWFVKDAKKKVVA